MSRRSHQTKTISSGNKTVKLRFRLDKVKRSNVFAFNINKITENQSINVCIPPLFLCKPPPFQAHFAFFYAISAECWILILQGWSFSVSCWGHIMRWALFFSAFCSLCPAPPLASISICLILAYQMYTLQRNASPSNHDNMLPICLLWARTSVYMQTF